MNRLVDITMVVLVPVIWLLSFVFIGGSFTGAVREHCLDVETSSELQRADIDSQWTYIMWPPLALSSIDPYGTCVRNSPGRELLAKVGIWELPPPEEQVFSHVQEQLDSARNNP